MWHYYVSSDPMESYMELQIIFDLWRITLQYCMHAQISIIIYRHLHSHLHLSYDLCSNVHFLCGGVPGCDRRFMALYTHDREIRGSFMLTCSVFSRFILPSGGTSLHFEGWPEEGLFSFFPSLNYRKPNVIITILPLPLLLTTNCTMCDITIMFDHGLYQKVTSNHWSCPCGNPSREVKKFLVKGEICVNSFKKNTPSRHEMTVPKEKAKKRFAEKTWNASEKPHGNS